MKMTWLVAASSAAMICSVNANAAQIITILDRSQFQAAIAGNTGISEQDFDSYSSGDTLTSDGAVNYSTNDGTPLITDTYITTSGFNGLGENNIGFFLSADTATFSFDTPVTAFAIDINTFANFDGAYTATLSDGSTAQSIFDTFPSLTTGEFIGFVTSDPFTSLTISANTSDSYTLDTLVYGQASELVSGAPEPSAWILMIAGLGMTGLGLRRRSRPLPC